MYMIAVDPASGLQVQLCLPISAQFIQNGTTFIIYFLLDKPLLHLNLRLQIRVDMSARHNGKVHAAWAEDRRKVRVHPNHKTQREAKQRRPLSNTPALCLDTKSLLHLMRASYPN